MQSNSVNLNPDTVKDLLPSKPVMPKKNIWDSPIKPRNGVSPLVNNLLPNVNKIKMNWIQLKMSFIDGKVIEQKDDPVHDYAEFLAYPNKVIENLANRIVEPGDSNDVKAYKILMWVQDNIEYKSDIENYGRTEWWTTPMETLDRMSGDCEDGAFLIHSLMLNAGIPWDRIRTYGGEVFAGAGAATGGHGWTSYMRELDDVWVVLDWCYYPNDKLVSERQPMSEDKKYIDDWFYIDTHAYVETPFANKVRNPMSAYDWSPRREFIKGQRISYSA